MMSTEATRTAWHVERTRAVVRRRQRLHPVTRGLLLQFRAGAPHARMRGGRGDPVHVDVYARTQCEQKVFHDMKGTPGRATAPGDAYECTGSEGRRQ